MHIVFIYPSMAEKETYRTRVKKGVIKTRCMEPLTIAALKGVTPLHHRTSFFDDRIEDTETLNYAIKKGFFIANFYQLTPFPGTALYSRLLSENRLHNKKWWLDENFRYGDMVFTPIKCTAQEMMMLCNLAKKKFYSIGSIFKRGFKFSINRNKLSHFILFFIVNLLSRKEMLKRKNSKLGRQ